MHDKVRDANISAVLGIVVGGLFALVHAKLPLEELRYSHIEGARASRTTLLS